MLNIVVVSVVLSICYNILIARGELLQFVARAINLSDLPNIIKKLLLCPYCIAGQLALWQCVYYNDYYISIPISIIIVYYFLIIFNKNEYNRF